LKIRRSFHSKKNVAAREKKGGKFESGSDANQSWSSPYNGCAGDGKYSLKES